MRDITLCHPRIQTLAAELIRKCADQGLQIKIGETLRTTAEQDALYAQGRSKPGKIVTNAKGSSYSSYHQWGVAFDQPPPLSLWSKRVHPNRLASLESGHKAGGSG